MKPIISTAAISSPGAIPAFNYARHEMLDYVIKSGSDPPPDISTWDMGSGA